MYITSTLSRKWDAWSAVLGASFSQKNSSRSEEDQEDKTRRLTDDVLSRSRETLFYFRYSFLGLAAFPNLVKRRESNRQLETLCPSNFSLITLSSSGASLASNNSVSDPPPVLYM